METNKTLSVIVPVYNAEKWLGRCIESKLTQSYESFELILDNHGSKDSSGEICDDYAKKDKRITVIHKENAGVSEARNTGIDIAKGKYIIFIDSDDAILQGFFEAVVAKMQTGIDWYICNLEELVISNEQILPGRVFKVELLGNVTILELFSAIDNGVTPAFVGCPCVRAYNTEIIKKHNIRFDPMLSLQEDLYFNLSYCKKIEKVFIL